MGIGERFEFEKTGRINPERQPSRIEMSLMPHTLSEQEARVLDEQVNQTRARKHMNQPFGCVNNTIRLRSGKYLDLADPRPDQFDFGDIAAGLSKICRFGGQCEHFYSVAEHCYHCADQALRDGMPIETQRAALMHDAAEAFIGDCVKPLKIMLPEYSRIEHMIEGVIGEKFDIDFWCESHLVGEIDRSMLIAERRFLFSRDNVVWTGEDEVRTLKINFGRWNSMEAERRFVHRAVELEII